MEDLFTFIDNLQEDLRNFEEGWEDKHRSKPDQYPMDMDAGMWWEMFLIYYNTGEI
jgi:hypothetical protein